jgi:hypothetical protein
MEAESRRGGELARYLQKLKTLLLFRICLYLDDVMLGDISNFKMG